MKLLANIIILAVSVALMLAIAAVLGILARQLAGPTARQSVMTTVVLAIASIVVCSGLFVLALKRKHSSRDRVREERRRWEREAEIERSAGVPRSMYGRLDGLWDELDHDAARKEDYLKIESLGYIHRGRPAKEAERAN
jgi:hypothetical protein